MPANPTIRQKALGNRLRSLREGVGMSIEQASEKLQCHPSKISRLENAKRPAYMRDVRDLALAYGASETESDELLRLVREASQRGWWESYDEVASRSATYIGFEDAAVRLDQYETVRVPGLLQTAEYTRALMRRIIPSLTPDAVEQYVVTRAQRRKLVLEREKPPTFWVVLDEAVVARQVGNAEIMAGQIEAIMTAAEQGLATVQLVPFDAGAHAGMEGSFSILRFADDQVSDVVYVEGRSGQLFLDRKADLGVFQGTLDYLRAVAINPDASFNLLASRAQDLRNITQAPRA